MSVQGSVPVQEGGSRDLAADCTRLMGRSPSRRGTAPVVAEVREGHPHLPSRGFIARSRESPTAPRNDPDRSPAVGDHRQG